LGIHHPQQIEFDRLNVTYTMMSKRKLLKLVQDKWVNGWDDPRMPTISGMRRRGYTAQALRNFCKNLGVSKTNGTTELSLLEYFVRDDLNKRASRVMAVLRPLKVVIDNYPDDLVEQMDAVNNPEDPAAGSRKVPFSKVLYIEQDDFREDPPKQYFRLTPGREVRLRILRHLHRRREKRPGRGGGGALHLRPSDARRRLSRWAQGEIDHSLGFGRARGRRRSAALRDVVY
jgi:glutaminyl-tRNA synthetase